MDEVERCFHEHGQPLFRYLVRLTGDGDLAADGVQETFLRVLERTRDQPIDKAWLFTVATNSVLGDLRTQARRRRILDASPERFPTGDPSPDAQHQLEARERHDRALTALDSLSEKERMAVLMREEGFSHREIAEAVGTTTGSVGTLIARALLKFTDALPPGSASA